MKNRLMLMSLAILGVFVISGVVTSASDTSVYSNEKYGISFTIPRGIKLYTAKDPGPLASQISSKTPFIFVNPDFTEENINVIVSENISESDMSDYKKMLDEKPNMPLPEYKRISVSFIKPESCVKMS